jgi:hypothetical protein
LRKAIRVAFLELELQLVPGPSRAVFKQAIDLRVRDQASECRCFLVGHAGRDPASFRGTAWSFERRRDRAAFQSGPLRRRLHGTISRMHDAGRGAIPGTPGSRYSSFQYLTVMRLEIVRLSFLIPGLDALNRAAYFLSASVGSFADPPRNIRFPSGNVMFLPTAIVPWSLP